MNEQVQEVSQENNGISESMNNKTELDSKSPRSEEKSVESDPASAEIPSAGESSSENTQEQQSQSMHLNNASSGTHSS